MKDSGRLDEIAQFLGKQWYEKNGLVAALLVVAVLEASLLISGKANWGIIVAVIIGSLLMVTGAWWHSRQPPKTPKKKIGFVVSIASANDRESEKLREDFVIPLRQLVKSGKAGKAFHFMELPQHLTKEIIEPDDAQALRVRTRAHFILYGRVRLRKLSGEDHHVLDLNGVVAHKPVPDHVGNSLAREFSELLPRKVHIPAENDLLAFQFTSEWADIVARYIIGIAAGCSGDLDYAETLFNDAHERVRTKDTEFPVYQKLTERIPTRISELYEARARSELLLWMKTKQFSHIDQLGKYLESVDKSRLGQPKVLNLRAINAFLKHRDVDGAIAYLKKSTDQNNDIWHFNMAFLYGYKEDLKASIRHYRKANSFQVEPETIAQVEDFICWVLQQEPEKYWLNYYLGFFNWKTKGDIAQAEKDFNGFLAAGFEEEFVAERTLARRWIETLSGEKKG